MRCGAASRGGINGKGGAGTDAALEDVARLHNQVDASPKRSAVIFLSQLGLGVQETDGGNKTQSPPSRWVPSELTLRVLTLGRPRWAR